AGEARFYLTNTTTATLTLNVADAQTSSTSPVPISYSSTGSSYRITNAESVEPVAGRPHLMRVTHYSGCSAANVEGTKDMSAWYEPTLIHPGGAAAPRMCPAPAGTPNSCLPDANPQTCGNAPLPSSVPQRSNLSLAFNGSANAYFCLKSTDIGNFYPQLSETANPDAATISSPLMTLRPFAVVVSGIKSGAVNNPATNAVATTANGGAAFVSAGTDFAATVGAYLWNAAGDTNVTNGDGFPDTDKTFAQITGGGVVTSYADIVRLTAEAPFAPSPGALGALSDNEVTISNGVQSSLVLDYSEVGAFTLAATSTQYQPVHGVNLANRMRYYTTGGANAAPNRVIGRFKPHYFEASGPTLEHGCDAGAFTYQGQAFRLGFTLRAMNRRGQVTTNYGRAGYAPVATGNVLSLVAENGDDGVNRGARIAPVTPTTLALNAWTNGLFVYPSPLAPNNNAFAFSRAANAEEPFAALAIGLGLTDTLDAVPLRGDMNAATTGNCTLCNAAMLGQTDMRFGRMRIPNGHGALGLPLGVPIETQFWSGGRFVRNTDDNCTALAAPSFAFAGYKDGLNAGNMNASNIGSPALVQSGAGAIRLASPNTTQKGSVLLQSALPHLPGSGQQTFGVFRGGPVIYFRERW
ncbi:MAG TPA: DUF6701 domain-containing protein, partial [Noviherbaspirillum sp.]